ncbi:MAG: Fe-S protein [Pseudomonadales bacterium]|nr:Fe-S protein [Pseudomonadales bacterium]
MLNRKRRSRPVDFGPYPLESLARDISISEREANRPPLVSLPPLPEADTALVEATRKYRKIFEELRKVTVFIRKAPLPENLERRTQDLKGAGYFLDASMIGLCKLPENAWVKGGARNPSHTHALVVLVEFSNPIDPDNMAAEWVQGFEHELATTRAAEISAILAGHIAALGFHAQAHWRGAGEVDLERLAVLSGLAIRDGDSVVNPYVGKSFALAAVTTEYIAATDIPLSTAAIKAKGLSYFLGLSGAVSGIERWRRNRRPSHFGPYPVEKLKRVEHPTTHIFDDEVPRIPQRANFYVRAERGDLGKRPLKERPRWAYKHPLSQGILGLLWDMVPYQDGEPATQKAIGTEDAIANTKAIKALSHYIGSAITGICEIPDYCWYSHRKDGSVINPYHKYAVVMLVDQGHETFEGACGDDWISGSQSMRSYMRGAEIAGTLADHIRRLGHSARAQTSIDSDVLHVPLVIVAGLGEQSRIGETALNPFLGPRIKTVVLTTDMPLIADKPIDFGLQQFCSKCLKCARECPSQSIPFGDKIIFNGYETWKPDSERCAKYRMQNMKGSACGRCIKVCPLTKDVTWDGPLYARIGSWLGIHAMWLKPILAPLAIWLDDKIGNGNPVDAKKWWLDLEVIGDQCNKPDANNYCDTPTVGINRKKLRPEHYIDPKVHRISYFPASKVPPPNMEGAYPTDRKAGLEIADRAETVKQALARRKNGGPVPEEYRTNW